MPYIITTKQIERVPSLADQPFYEHDEVLSRCAVATLDEARRSVADYIALAITHGWRELADDALALPEAGGIIGPLPDGTVIEVEPVGWLELIDPAHPMRETPATHAEAGDHAAQGAIIAAYNKAQAQVAA